MAGMFAGFEPYRLTGVQVTDKEYGRGSYAAVVGVEYRGLKCAGKKLHIVLVEEGEREIIYRFEGECRLLAQMRHPNIVQFIGVYFEEDSEIPILVMEFLPTTLARCIDTYGVLPEEINYSILHDVALGLCHLHSQTPPIVHRDLSANNVLLTPNMTAKVSDLGVARILNLTPQQMSRMTRAPGTLAYMPPEALSENPRYDTRIDEFSYGVLMIHVLCGRWPFPSEPVCVNPENQQLIPVSEAERRNQYLRDIGNAHPLMDLILRCVSNIPAQRARAAEIVQRLAHMTHQFPPAFVYRVAMLRQIGADQTEKEQLRNEKNATQALLHVGNQQQWRLTTHIEQLHTENAATQAQLREEIQRLEQLSRCVSTELEQSRQEAETAAQQHLTQVEQLHTENTTTQAQLRGEIERLERLSQHRQEEIECSELAHSIEIEQLRLQLVESQTQSKVHQTELRTKIETHQTELTAQSEAREEERRTLRNRQGELAEEIARMRCEIEGLLITISSKDEVILSKEREIRSKDGEIQLKTAELSVKSALLSQIEAENEQLRTALLSRDREIELKQHEICTITQELNETITVKSMEISGNQEALAIKNATLTERESELTSKNTILEQQSSTIQRLHQQLTRAREFLAGQKPQPHPLHPQAKITWEPCSEVPMEMYRAQTVVIQKKFYYGGGGASANDEYQVFCYSPSEDTWTTLPTCPVRWFGLGQVRGKLVTVGGKKESGGELTNKVYEFDEVTQTWKQSIPPMPTARCSPAVLSLYSALIVAGGYTGYTRTTAVEVFREKTSQWHTTEPLPFRWRDATSVLMNNRWYLLGGGTERETYSNRAVCAHVDLLLQKTVPRDRTSTDMDDTIWHVFPNTPLYGSAAATFGTSLLTVGGSTNSQWPPDTQVQIHVFAPCTNTWVHISDLPTPLVWTATAMLSPTELLVIGGWNNGRLKKVYKGLLHIE